MFAYLQITFKDSKQYLNVSLEYTSINNEIYFRNMHMTKLVSESVHERKCKYEKLSVVRELFPSHNLTYLKNSSIHRHVNVILKKTDNTEEYLRISLRNNYITSVSHVKDNKTYTIEQTIKTKGSNDELSVENLRELLNKLNNIDKSPI